MCSEAGFDQEFRVSVVPTGIVRLTWTPGAQITGPLAASAMAAVNRLNGERRRPLLVEMAGTGTPTREARAQFARRSTASRIALLGGSAVDRVHASFVAGIGASPVPTRYFTSAADAASWLLAGAGAG
jgi:hypothetical protein